MQFISANLKRLGTARGEPHAIKLRGDDPVIQPDRSAPGQGVAGRARRAGTSDSFVAFVTQCVR
jgi:hypothetical protein